MVLLCKMFPCFLHFTCITIELLPKAMNSNSLFWLLKMSLSIFYKQLMGQWHLYIQIWKNLGFFFGLALPSFCDPYWGFGEKESSFCFKSDEVWPLLTFCRVKVYIFKEQMHTRSQREQRLLWEWNTSRLTQRWFRFFYKLSVVKTLIAAAEAECV